MGYKIINNALDSNYWINLIDATFSFKKIHFSDLFEELQEEQKAEQKDETKNEIVLGSIFNTGMSIDKILAASPANLNNDEKKEVINEVKPFVDKINQQKLINENDNIDPDEKLKQLAKKIELITPIQTQQNYSDKILKVLWAWGTKNFEEYINTLVKYKDAVNLTWYDIWSIAWSINSLFSAFFQSTFTELSQYFPKLSWLALECDEKNALDKIIKNQPLELYEMFKLINWIQENNKVDLISLLKNQENKDNYNLLKSYLESEAFNWNIKWHFYVLTLDQLRRFRNFHAHHDDERLIEKIIRWSSPEKMKNKFYSKFLGDLEEDGKWFLQFVLERV